MIWLIGSSGMLGCEIKKKLSESSIQYITSNSEVDVTDFGMLEKFSRDKSITWVINCSGYTAVDMAEDEKERAYAVNRDGVKNIAGLFENTGVRIIHFSTDYVFPGIKPDGYSEDDETGTAGVYGFSKLEGERALSALTEFFFILRISWLYGRTGKNFVHTMLDLFETKDEINVVNDQYGSPTFAGELAGFTVDNLLSSGSDKYGIYHFSGTGMTTWYEFSCEIYRLALKYGVTDRALKIKPVDSSEFPVKARRPAYSYLLKDKLCRTFNFTPADWRVTLDAYIRSLSRRMPE